MKRIPLVLLSLATMLLCHQPLLWAAPRTVTINWVISDSSNVVGYKVYYADTESMDNKVWHSNCSDPVENQSNILTTTCSNIDLIDGQTYYFSVAAQMTDGTELFSSSKYATIEIVMPAVNLKITN